MRNPYPGLRPFRADEEHLFFGRESQVDRMVSKLAATRFLAVVGTSGSGKSSLVNCGLKPALHRGYMASAGSAWRMTQFRPGSDPIGALAQALAEPGALLDDLPAGALGAAELAEATLRLGSLGLVTLVEQADLAPGTQFLVVVDQFEELFRTRSGDAVAFVQLLLEAVTQREHPIHVVLTMRSDFLGDCAQYIGLPEAINESQYLVPRLTREQIRAAIQRPAGVQGERLSALLVTRLLNDVGDNPDQLSTLQHALNRTWARWESDGGGRGEIELQHYERIGGIQNALDNHAEKAYAELPDDGSRRLCEKILRTLTDTGTDGRGVRRMTRLDALCRIVEADRARVEAVLGVFRKPSRSFLMPPASEALHDASDIDISHESLMRLWKRLAGWAEAERQSARLFRELREKARKQQAGEASLWRGPELDLALRWEARDAPGAAWAALYGGGWDDAKRFLDASRAQLEREKLDAEIERRWRGGWNVLPLALMALAFMVIQLYLAREGSARGGLILQVLEMVQVPESAAQEIAPWLAHVFAGIPAAFGYFAIRPLLRRWFWTRAAAHIRREAEAARIQAEGAVSPGIPVSLETVASFWRRALAQAVDWLLAILLLVGVFLVWVFVLVTVGRRDPSLVEVVLVALGSWTLLLGAYHVLSWRSRWQATLGMKLAGTVVTDLHGRPIGGWRGGARFAARLISYYLVGLGFLMQPFGGRGQALHDRIAGTLVLVHPARLRRPAPAVPPVAVAVT